MKQPCHNQEWAKVNTPVDAAIVDLIEILSSFPYLETVESCQGNDKEPAWVCFLYGRYWERPWQELAEFVFGFLGPRLIAEIGDDVSLSVRLTGDNLAIGHLTVRPGAINRTTKALKLLSQDY